MSHQWKSDERVRLLRELTEIPSGSANHAGVDAIQDIVAREVAKLGFQVSFEKHPQGRSGKFLIGERVGAEPGSKFVSLITHADTVFEESSGFKGFTLDERTGVARGPGVLDDKAGILVALEGVKRYLALSGKSLNLRFLCTPTEELGSPGFEGLFSKLSADSSMILGFEPAVGEGSIIESRRGNRWYHISVDGKEGHAGRDTARGINAAHELACKIVEIHRLADPKKELTVSTGQISGGSKFNVICGHAEAKVDVRFSDFATRDRVHGQIEEIIRATHIGPNEKGELPRSSYELANDCPPFAAAKTSEPYVAKYLALVNEVERDRVEAVKSGGAADSNYMSREGLVILDGLGAVGGGIHSREEFVRLESLETRAECLARFLKYVEDL